MLLTTSAKRVRFSAAHAKTIAAALLLYCSPAGASPEAVGHPWAFATAPGAGSTRAFLTLRNIGTEDHLLGIDVQYGNARLGGAITHGGIRPPLPLRIAGGSTVAFSLLRLHVEVSGLPDPLRTGQYLSIRLHFERAGRVPVSLHVEPLGTVKPLHGDDEPTPFTSHGE